MTIRSVEEAAFPTQEFRYRYCAARDESCKWKIQNLGRATHFALGPIDAETQRRRATQSQEMDCKKLH
jgi:hypothetical protein